MRLYKIEPVKKWWIDKTGRKREHKDTHIYASRVYIKKRKKKDERFLNFQRFFASETSNRIFGITQAASNMRLCVCFRQKLRRIWKQSSGKE